MHPVIRPEILKIEIENLDHAVSSLSSNALQYNLHRIHTRGHPESVVSPLRQMRDKIAIVVHFILDRDEKSETQFVRRQCYR